MTTCNVPSTPPSKLAPDGARHARLRATKLFRGDALERWRAAELVVIGAGVLGSRLAPEAVRSGARVLVVDPDRGELANLGTQAVRAGESKVTAVVRACDEIEPGRARGRAMDVRALGVGELVGAAALVDASDDPELALTLVRLSNGLGLPYVRVAVDGSGARELGRVAVSHGGAGHACGACPWSRADLARVLHRTPCLDAPKRGPTRAGGALGAAISGLALLQLQRIVTGNDDALALDRELVLDLDGMELHALELRRSERCLSAHESWALEQLDEDAAELELCGLFERARRALRSRDISLEPWQHALYLEAHCGCGARTRAVGTRSAAPPVCSTCEAPMRWRTNPSWPRFGLAEARALGVERSTLAALGLPATGALVTARAPGGAALRFLCR